MSGNWSYESAAVCLKISNYLNTKETKLCRQNYEKWRLYYKTLIKLLKLPPDLLATSTIMNNIIFNEAKSYNSDKEDSEDDEDDRKEKIEEDLFCDRYAYDNYTKDNNVDNNRLLGEQKRDLLILQIDFIRQVILKPLQQSLKNQQSLSSSSPFILFIDKNKKTFLDHFCVVDKTYKEILLPQSQKPSNSASSSSTKKRKKRKRNKRKKYSSSSSNDGDSSSESETSKFLSDSENQHKREHKKKGRFPMAAFDVSRLLFGSSEFGLPAVDKDVVSLFLINQSVNITIVSFGIESMMS